ncbi:thermonuclease family protein [Thermodesulfobacteriota bacterium]
MNEEILTAGYAWQYRKYCKASFYSDWLKLEEDAKAAKIGLWADPKAVPP